MAPTSDILPISPLARLPGSTAAQDAAVTSVLEGAAFAGARGWVPATSGNFSARVDADSVAITATGTDKARLTRDNIIIVQLENPAHPRASAEAPLHVDLYRAFPEIAAIFHVHSPAATLLSLADAGRGAVRIQGFELQKALAGVKTHEVALDIPVFANSQDMAVLGPQVLARLGDAPAVPGYLLAGHGLYAWGRTPAEARRHLEALEVLLGFEFERRRLQP
ncbi:methylthioribulose 1-phosphate dehydratase [Inquilinus limosus]|uniref:Methylthioribulose-1-phosphate dehydratase n=1 Tax=Inquilinus limosus TaxID=171674 RepID=A0A211ZGV0_9PROT|nr:methylthioribulose 1-phosphate dehydratase [Inquilinus limosus]OWJ64485.1 methylthioribulose 1-phosphate dehydratase [Inquilinus limosus]